MRTTDDFKESANRRAGGRFSWIQSDGRQDFTLSAQNVGPEGATFYLDDIEYR